MDHLALPLQDEEVVSEGAAPHQLHAYLHDDLPIRLPKRFSIEEQLLYRDVQRFRGGLVFKAHRRLNHSTLGLRVIKKKRVRNENRDKSIAVIIYGTKFWRTCDLSLVCIEARECEVGGSRPAPAPCRSAP